MTVGEAKSLAREWSAERAKQIPEFAGAYVSGSMALMEDDEQFPYTSDADLCLVLSGDGHNSMVEVEGEFRQRAILYKGVDLEPTYPSVRGYQDPELILGSLESPAFEKPTNILLDLTGALAKVQREVSGRHKQERWVRKRCEAARDFALGCLQTASVGAPRLPGWATDQISMVQWLYTGALRAAAQIPCVANLGGITSRKGFVASREVLRSVAMLDLYERILKVCGTDGVTRTQAAGFLQELRVIFDHAVRIIRTPFWCDLEFQEFMKPKLFDGAWQLVEGGDHREAMPYILFLRGMAQNVVENDAPEPERVTYRKGFADLLSALGVATAADIAAKGDALKQLLPEIMGAARVVIESNPRIDRS